MAIYFDRQHITGSSDPSTAHPDYDLARKDWERIRDAMMGETQIKIRGETYLPRPEGMKGTYEDAYEPYKQRAHYPQIASYALQGALGVIITKLPEFNVPKKLEYILRNATKDGQTLQQLFIDMIIEILQTGRCPILVDVEDKENKFKFVRYSAESLLNWKEDIVGNKKVLIMSVLKETMPASDDIFSHDEEDVYRVLILDENNQYTSRVFESTNELLGLYAVPSYFGRKISEIPLFVAGSINNSLDNQPIPLLSVANCSIQIYRKEADLANSEYLSCNPTLVMVGASNDDDLPNVVGSSVMIVLPDPQARVFYTTTDTAALQHVKTHIDDLYEEAIRHGVAILDTRKGVESAEALRIRQATQSASIYSIYLSALNAVKSGLQLMCRWAGLNEEEVTVDAPSALTHGIPDADVIRAVAEGLGASCVPLSVIHRYLVSSGLLDQTVSLEDYMKQLVEQQEFFKKHGIVTNQSTDPTLPLDKQKNGGINKEVITDDKTEGEEQSDNYGA
jgi:hypothetical protein